VRGKALLAIGAIATSVIMASAHPALAADRLIYGVDFSGFPGGSVLTWLGSKGFVPKQDAGNARRVVYSGSRGDLELETKRHAFGLLLNETDIRDASRVRIEWGVEAFPPGASYEKGVRSEAVMLYIFFGKERHSSGALFVPDSPYFIGLFLCESEPTNELFKGRYYHAGGRFVCVDRPPPGATVTTDFPIAQAFTRAFGKAQVPDISGFGIAIDTASAKGGGVAKAFIKKIEFLD
jgi:hypothetical protein